MGEQRTILVGGATGQQGGVVASAGLERGFIVSFSGILTFKNAESLREVAREVPLDQLLVELRALREGDGGEQVESGLVRRRRGPRGPPP